MEEIEHFGDMTLLDSGIGNDERPVATRGEPSARSLKIAVDKSTDPEYIANMRWPSAIREKTVYEHRFASGPSDDWTSPVGEDPVMQGISLIETQTALGPDQSATQDIVFSQKLEYVLLSVQDAILEPEGQGWQTVSPRAGSALTGSPGISSVGDEVISKLMAIDQTNVDTLQARWENVELPPGTYALEIWTPGDTSARVSYTVLSAGRLLDERVSYQSTRQTKGEVNQWMDFSKTLNPSLVVEMPASGQVTVIAKPSPRGDNRDFNLSGNVVFGVGPVRLAKQQ